MNWPCQNLIDGRHFIRMFLICKISIWIGLANILLVLNLGLYEYKLYIVNNRIKSFNYTVSWGFLFIHSVKIYKINLSENLWSDIFRLWAEILGTCLFYKFKYKDKFFTFWEGFLKNIFNIRWNYGGVFTSIFCGVLLLDLN